MSNLRLSAMGTYHDLTMSLALRYLPYLGTDQYSPQGIRREFFRLGLTLDTKVDTDQFMVYISVLEEFLEAGVELSEHLLNNVKADPRALEDLIANIIKEREDEKAGKQTILREGLGNYGKYGANNPFINRLSREALLQQDPEALAAKIRTLTQYKHRIFYYGQAMPDQVQSILDQHHPAYEQLGDYRLPRAID